MTAINSKQTCPQFLRAIVSALAAALLTGCAAVGGSTGAFDFGVIGDMPYTRVQEKEYQRVLTVLNATQLELGNV